MTKGVVLTKLRKIHGPTLVIRDRRRKSDKETAEIIKEALIKHRAARPLPPPPTPEEIAYTAAVKQWRKVMDRLEGNLWMARAERYEAVTQGPLFSHVVKTSDTLEGLLP